MLTLRRFAALSAALCAVAAHAGLKLTLEMKRKGKTASLTMQMEGKNVRMEMTKEGSAEPGGAYIVDSDGKRVLMVDYAKKEYHEITQEQMRAMKAKMEAAMAMMKERMAQLPPEQRKQMEAAMAHQMPSARPTGPEEKFVRASGSKTVAGYKCELYTVEVNGEHVADACQIPWSELKVDREQLKQAMEGMTEAWDLGPQKMENPMVKAWGMNLGLPGWRKTVKPNPDEATESTLTSLTQGAVPKSAFEPPAGFTRKSLGKGME